MNFRKFSRLEDNSNFIVDMTALVDIAFIIILFLGIVSTLAPISSINVELPKATAEKTSVEPLKIIVDKEGNYYIRNKKVSEKEIAEYIKSQTSKSLVIIADRRVQYGKVVKVMDIAKQNGIEEINIATRRGR
ncbi:MAG TPA: biopolymer transporter ExbD [Persephonella sp.]|uniref:Biopolymer transport protein ExbD/TolR n=1 Tax=Persephonella marina (strain DSM 14350 / EX-H1) TaxID=123214 RepID=C0QSS4_PERMH|nr:MULTISPECIES: biopolymer transporter ExbD [Persephonella]ACO04265.1 biopolymer transport protein ExbD/TolR [Persephonella marina EX-H1]HCB70642.1 biopolymer transporter ExbD [Persephonella sp.]